MILRSLAVLVTLLPLIAQAQEAPPFVPAFWAAVGTPADSAGNPAGLHVYYAPHSRILFGLNTLGIFSSVDHGGTWQVVSEEFKGTWVQAFRETNTGALLATGPFQQMYRSSDHGASWHVIADLPARPATQFWTDGTPYVFACLSNNALYRSTDDGQSWSPCGAGLPTDHWAQALVRLSNGDLLVSTGLNGEYGLYRSTDNGDHWSPSNAELEGVLVWTLSEAAPGVALAGGMNKGLYRSTDYGHTWTNSSSGFLDSTKADVQQLQVDGDGTVYASAGYASGPHRSTDGGRHWQSISEGLDMRDFGYFTIDADGYLYTGTRIGTYRASERVSPVLAVQSPEADLPHHGHSVVANDNTIVLEAAAGTPYQIMNASGATVLNGTIPPEMDGAVNVSGLVAGVYIAITASGNLTFLKLP